MTSDLRRSAGSGLRFAILDASMDPKRPSAGKRPNAGVRLAIVRFSSALSNQKFPYADPPAPNPMITPPLPEQIELHRDRMWRRDEDLRVESAVDAERFIEDVGFASTLKP